MRWIDLMRNPDFEIVEAVEAENEQKTPRQDFGSFLYSLPLCYARMSFPRALAWRVDSSSAVRRVFPLSSLNILGV